MLRRNIHRIEKGLLMKPFRDVFALEYIFQTVACFGEILRERGLFCTEEIQWAHDVLSAYFSSVRAHPEIDRAKQEFDAFPPIVGKEGAPHIPHALGSDASLPPVGYDDLLCLARHRKSVRWYLPKPVPRELIDKAIVVATLSPSACNRQPYEFRIFDDPALVRKVSSICYGTAGYSDNIPAVAVVIGKSDAFHSERDRHRIYTDASLAIMSFVYALEAQGLCSCCVNWPELESLERPMRDILKLTLQEQVVMLVAFGYPDPEGMVAYSQRKSLDQVRKYN
jgi:nitroreductase